MDVATGALPPPNRARLRGGPLGLVGFQFDWDGGAKPNSRLGMELQRRLQKTFPELSTLSQAINTAFSIELGIGGLATSTNDPEKGWRVATRDGSVSVSCFNQRAIIEARRYDGWSEGFRPLVIATLEAVRDLRDAEVATRTGLRYVNAFSSPEAASPNYWLADRIAPTLFGVLPDAEFGAHLQSSVQRTLLAFPNDRSATVGVAIRPDAVHSGASAIVLDIDVFHEGPREYIVDQEIDAVDALNTIALQIFQRFVTSEYLGQFRD